MARQGSALGPDIVRRIVYLLSETDMTVKDIAERMQCSRGTVLSINRRFLVRDYGGLRATWQRIVPQGDEARN
jgi:hypothetical protein